MKKTIAIILEVIPLFSAVISFMLIKLNNNSELLKYVIMITMSLAFFGFIFFFVDNDSPLKVWGLFIFIIKYLNLNY